MEESPNREAVMVWSDIVGPKFMRHRKVITAGFSAHSQAAIDLFPVKPDDCILDVGCGFGDTSIQLAHAASAGRVVGFDCAPIFLDAATADARDTGLSNLEYALGDAQTYPFTPTFDRIFSRFGTMFFANPAAAMRNLRRALKPGGLLTMVVWRGREQNDWARLPREVAEQMLPPPEEGPTCGPGPFSMADPEVVTAILNAAGWKRISFAAIEAEVNLGRTVEDAAAFALDLGPAGELMRLAGDAGEAVRPQLVDALQALFSRYLRPGGVVLAARSWCVSAS
jgi:ubiquinone/menaquinone biosynthesis C-methylase UbiE